MKKILAIKGFVNKVDGFARFINVAVKTVNFFREEMEKEFPDNDTDNTPTGGITPA